MKSSTLLFAIVALIVALGAGYYLGKQSCNTEITKETEVVNRDVVTIVKEIKRADGSSETTTTTTDKSKEKKSEVAVLKSAPAPANRLGISALSANFRESEAYQLTYERRIAGPLWLCISATTKQTYGIGLSYEF